MLRNSDNLCTSDEPTARYLAKTFTCLAALTGIVACGSSEPAPYTPNTASAAGSTAGTTGAGTTGGTLTSVTSATVTSGTGLTAGTTGTSATLGTTATTGISVTGTTGVTLTSGTVSSSTTGSGGATATGAVTATSTDGSTSTTATVTTGAGGATSTSATVTSATVTTATVSTSTTGGGTCTPPTPGTSGQNPLFTNIFTADPAPLVHNCTFYIAAGHDEGSTGFLLREWYVLSSTDMVNWTDNGGPKLALTDFDWVNANAWAGQMVQKDGKFYWYVPVNQQGGAMTIGVAVADSPLGPFTDAIGGPLINDQIEMDAFGYNDPGQTVYTIDPTVFVDDDNQAYLAYGGFGRMVVARLGADMISIDGEMDESTPPGFFEAPFLFKRNGTYYLVYASGINPAAIDYVTSSSPMGPWSSGGRILDPLGNNPGEDAATSHPGVAEFAGQWYLVYHLSDGPGGGTYRRQVAVEKLTFDANGDIQQVEPSPGLTF